MKNRAMIFALVLFCAACKNSANEPAKLEEPDFSLEDLARRDSIKTIVDHHLVILDSLTGIQNEMNNRNVTDSILDSRISNEKEIIDSLVSELDKKPLAEKH